ncbi:MAG: tetratricopeptide repeat protein [Alloprevotella sp.]|nr:tetratricopeptide repeat protein [Alloprevotella sp.]
MSTKNELKKQNKQAADTNDFVSSSEAFLIKNQKKIIIALVALVILIAGFFLAKNLLQNREDKAQTLLTQGLTYVQQGDYDKALNGDNVFPGFVKIANGYSFTDASNIAKLWAGICYAKKADFKQAIKFLEDFSPKSDHMISPAGLATLANCYAEIGEIDKAVKTFEKAAKLADNDATSPEYLLQAGVLLQSQNKQAEAAKLYEKIKSDYPGSSYNFGNVTADSIIEDGLIEAYIESTKE